MMMKPADSAEQSSPGDRRQAMAPSPRALESSAPLSGQDRVAIRHGAETYHLRLTRQGKLILTK